VEIRRNPFRERDAREAREAREERERREEERWERRERQREWAREREWETRARAVLMQDGGGSGDDEEEEGRPTSRATSVTQWAPGVAESRPSVSPAPIDLSGYR
jgi:hypothetical protein